MPADPSRHAVDTQAVDAHIGAIVQFCNAGKLPDAVAEMKVLRAEIGEVALVDCLRIALPDAVPPKFALDLGRVIAHQFPAFRAVQPGVSPEGGPDAPYLNVIGTSHARSFGAHPDVFPLFLGIGRTTLVLNDELLQQAVAKFDATACRLDPDQPTLVVMGGDARFHHANGFGTRESQGDDLTDADFAVMDFCADRYFQVRDLVCKYVKAPVGLYCVLPTYDEAVNRLTKRMNTTLAALCAERGVPFVNVCDAVTDDGGECLDPAYAASAFKGDFHLNFDALPHIVEAVNGSGLVKLGIPAENYNWRYVFSFSFFAGEETRIWNEPDVSPSNALTSEKIAATQTTLAVVPYLITQLASRPPRRLVVVNAAEGLLPINVPVELVREIIVHSTPPAAAAQLRHVARLAGRDDIHVVPLPAGASASAEAEAGTNGDILVGLTFPDTGQSDSETLCTAVDFYRPAEILLFGTEISAMATIERQGYEMVTQVGIGNRHLPGAWQQFQLVHYRRRTG